MVHDDVEGENLCRNTKKAHMTGESMKTEMITFVFLDPNETYCYCLTSAGKLSLCTKAITYQTKSHLNVDIVEAGCVFSSSLYGSR